MRLLPAIRSISTVRISLDMAASVRGTGVLTGSSEALDLPDISDSEYQNVLLNKYRIEDTGIIEVFELKVKLVWNVKGNGAWRWQVSGDEGLTWTTIAEVTTNQVAFTQAFTEGAGTWLSSIDTGDDKFQIRLQAKAASGTVSTQVVDASFTSSYVVLKYRKKDRS